MLRNWPTWNFCSLHSQIKCRIQRGWLRRAIEEDYGPPDGFITPEERAQLDAEAVEQAQRASAAELQHQTFVAERQAQQKARLRQLQVRYGTTGDFSSVREFFS